MSLDPFVDDEFDHAAWTFRGHRLSSGQFVSSLAHEYRAEVQRTNSFRLRLDVTTNWAVIVTSVSISIAFSQPNVHHGVLILNALLISSFLLVEARRYRYYEMWNLRVRGLETDFFAALLGASAPRSSEWARQLAENMSAPRLPISMVAAVGIRLRQNFLWIFSILGIAWLAKYWLFPAPPANWNEFVNRAAIGSIPGSIVVSFSILYFSLLVLVALFTMSLTGSKSSHEGTAIRSEMPVWKKGEPTKRRQTWFGRKQEKSKALAFIVTDKADDVAKSILDELKRGVTSVAGDGSTLLICALNSNEVRVLKNLVNKVDVDATVNVTPIDQVWGKGFTPLANQ